MYYVPGSALKGFEQLVEKYLHDPKQLMLNAGVDPESLKLPNAKVPGQNAFDLMESAATQLDERHFGIQLAQIQDASILGTLWFLIKNAQTIGSAVKIFVDNYAIHASANFYSLQPSERGVYLVFNVNPSIQGEYTQVIEHALTQCCLTVRRYVSPDWNPEVVCFREKKPKDTRLMASIFGDNILFKQEFDGLLLTLDELNLPIKEASEIQRIHFENDLSLEQDLEPLSNIVRVESIINANLTKHNCTLKYVAYCMNMKPRTLQHLLKQNGTSFSAIVQKTKLNLACRYLQDSSLSITEISERLFFSDISLFTRFIKKHTGQTPTQIRKQYSNK